MNQEELEKRTNEGIGYVLRLIVDRKIKDDEIAETLMKAASGAYDSLSYEEFQRHLRFCMNAAKYVRGEYSPTFLLFQAKGLDELINDERCNREFAIVDRVYDGAVDKIGDTVLREVDYFTSEEMIPHLKITAKALLNSIRILERCRIRRGLKRSISTHEDLERVLRDTYKILKERESKHQDPEIRARSKEKRENYEIILKKWREVYPVGTSNPPSLV